MKVITDYFTPPKFDQQYQNCPTSAKDESLFSDENEEVYYETRKIRIRLADPAVPDSYVCEVYDTSLDEKSPEEKPCQTVKTRRNSKVLKKVEENNQDSSSPSAFDVLMGEKREKISKKRARQKRSSVNEEVSDSDDEALILVRKKLKGEEVEPKESARSLRVRRAINVESKNVDNEDASSRIELATKKTKASKKKRTIQKKVVGDLVSNNEHEKGGPRKEKIVKNSQEGKIEKKSHEETTEKKTQACDIVYEKLAPVFFKKKKDVTDEKAKMEFLQSGLPPSMRKKMELRTLEEKKYKDVAFFPSISHIQQKNDDSIWSHRTVDLIMPPYKEYCPDKVIWTRTTKSTSITKSPLMSPVAQMDDRIIEKLKVVYKHMDIDGLVNGFRRKKEDLNDVWSEKYKIGSSGILSNEKTVAKLGKWLTEWKQSGNEVRQPRKKATAGSSDDFVSSDEDAGSDFPVTACLLQGPTSSGKTTLVHALANELDFNILEVNSSSKRSGKKMLADLQEATKSHRIQQEASNSQSSKDKMTVIVVEEADIVFDQDEGYVSGLQNLILSAKRPVILLTSDSSSPHLEKFRSPSQTLQLAMARPAISSACAILELVSLLEGVAPPRSFLHKLLSRNNCDLRKSLLEIQFWFDHGGNDFKTLNASSLTSTGLWKTSQTAFFNDDLKPVTKSELNKKKETKETETKQFISDFLQFSEYLSFSDLFRNGRSDRTNLSSKQFQIKDSSSLDEDFSVHDVKSMDSLNEVENCLLAGAASCLRPYLASVNGGTIKDPAESRWIASRKKASSTLLKGIPSKTDAYATYLDYLPTLRAISRTENDRAMSNTKRTNRFYHYLRTIGINASDTDLDINCNSLLTDSNVHAS